MAKTIEKIENVSFIPWLPIRNEFEKISQSDIFLTKEDVKEAVREVLEERDIMSEYKKLTKEFDESIKRGGR